MLFSVRFRRILPATLILLLSLGAAAQTPPSQATPSQANRILPQPDLARATRLSGHLPAWVDPSTDVGTAPDDTPVRLTLVLSRTPALQTAFEELLTDQQNSSSPRYHQWLTPTQIGEQFGPTLDDVGAITTWLTGSGLHLAELSPARTFLTVTGTSGVAASTFATTFHQFTYDGQPHLSATTEPAIPTAFATVISSIQGLTDLPVHPMVHVQTAQPRAAPDSLEPLYSSGNGLAHYIFPGDFATIYNITPSTRAGYTGLGVRVAVIGRSQIANSDITQLEDLAQLQQKTPTVVLVPGSADPGVVSVDTDESTLDVGRVLTTATGAAADLVIAAPAAGGIAAAIQYNINTLQDPVMTISYGACESAAGASGVNFYNTLFAQAAAQGMSIFVSSGDAAAAGCSPYFSTPKGNETLGMGNYICSNPYVTCVGGTQLNDANPAAYWAPGQTTAPYASALGYIPEGAWNEPTNTNSNGATVFQIAGTGSGPSAFIPKPSWQTGIGVPADGARDIPDVSFTSSSHDGTFGCLAYVGAGGDCSRGGGIIFYGTSVAAPSMAAIAAILDQRLNSAQGNLNPLLYKLAASTPAAFHDATPASSGVLGCTTATATLCNNSVASPTSISGGLAGYPLQVGYDLVTGLGSLDVTQFINAAALDIINAPPTVMTVSASPSFLQVNGTAVFSATVTPTGSSVPTGSVRFLINSVLIVPPVPLVNGTAVTPATAFSTPGTYLLNAAYSGDVNNAPSYATASLPFVVASGAPTTTALTATPNPVAFSPAPLTLSVTVAANSGSVTPTGGIDFYINGLNGQYAPLVARKATLTTPIARAGTIPITAIYSGDTTFAASVSTVNVVVNPIPTTTNLTVTPATVAAGQTVTLSAIATNGPYPASTGTFLFYSGSTVLGPAVTSRGGIATATYTFPTAGTYPITAVFSGDLTVGLAASTSAPSLLTVTSRVASSLTVTASPANPIPAGSTATLTAAVAVSGTGTPTGTIQFLANGNAFGSPIALTGTTAQTTAFNTKAVGTYAITAVYSGDATYATSTSPAVSVVVAAQMTATGLAVTASPSSLVVSAAAASTATATVTATTPNSFTGTVSLTCAVTPATSVPPTCALSSSTLSFASAQSATSTLTLATITPHDHPSPATLTRRTPFSSALKGVSLAALFVALIPATRRRRVPRLHTTLPLALLLGATLLTLSGCGSSTSGPGSTVKPVLSGTTTGTYVVTVTATSGTTTATSTSNLTVQ